MSRYNSTLFVKTNTDRTRQATTILPTLDTAMPNDILIRTTTPERLDKLSQYFYGNVSDWWIIAAANNLGKGTLIIPSNTSLRIPIDTNAYNKLSELNRTR